MTTLIISGCLVLMSLPFVLWPLIRPRDGERGGRG